MNQASPRSQARTFSELIDLYTLKPHMRHGQI